MTVSLLFSAITCPALPKVPVGTYNPSSCDNGTMTYPSSCELICPSGYHINYLPTAVGSDSRSCLVNGTWTYRETSPACLGIFFVLYKVNMLPIFELSCM